ncbi:hypothetical protein GEV43_00395 [Actinomadura sp. J1-007]|uniref:hypothetical protein n=1 Tax=Actinomadura sp. J1-007 TaxID=2661913 RepID=UPI001329EA3B|nr:hypothetical protein [Actinomadura sp. J1-007]MWK32680.1 hypothetical protein [Actinomadura sp. J1-007]
MRADELLTEIEPLAYRERCGRLAGLRRSAGDPALAGLLDELAARGHYERSLALFVAAAVRDEASRAHVARAMRDPDARLAAEAIALAARFGLGRRRSPRGWATPRRRCGRRRTPRSAGRGAPTSPRR